MVWLTCWHFIFFYSTGTIGSTCVINGCDARIFLYWHWIFYKCFLLVWQSPVRFVYVRLGGGGHIVLVVMIQWSCCSYWRQLFICRCICAFRLLAVRYVRLRVSVFGPWHYRVPLGTMARGDVTVPLCCVFLAAHSVYAPEFLFFGLPCVCNCWLLVGCHNAIASSPPVPAASCETVARVVGRVNLVIGLLWGQGYTHVA